MKVQLNGNITIAKSKTLLSDEEKDRVLTASPGKAKAVRVTLLDENGRPVVLQGKLYKNATGSLTARFNAKLEASVVEVNVKQEKDSDEQTTIDQLAAELNL